MKALAPLAVLLGLSLACRGEGPGAARPGAIVFQTGFELPAEREAWGSAAFAAWDKGPFGGAALKVAVPREEAAGSHMLRLPLDLSPYRGCRLLFECVARAEAVSEPSAPWLGVKFMLHYRSASAGEFWKNEDRVHGTFDWRPLRFTATVAPDAAEGEIYLGLQDCSGAAWFDSVKVTVLGAPLVRPAPPADPPPAYRGHGLPRLRGVMSPNEFREEDLRVLGREWRANVIRWQITRNWDRVGTDRDLAEYDGWLEGRLRELDRALESCRAHGLKVVVDLHTPPGGRDERRELAIFHEPKYQDHFVAVWEKIARRYKGHPSIWGYDLVNEPVQGLPSPAGLGDYLGAQARAGKAIRAIDPAATLFLEANDWDSPSGFRELEPVGLSNVVYQVHVYVPHEFTHQGVFGKWIPTAYPGEIGGMRWDKERLRESLRPVREFQRAYNTHVYVGEFSAARWAPGAAHYLGDCIDLFEEYGWDWTFHAYREWDGWSVEHGEDPQDHRPSRTMTDRQKLLLGWFARNAKPSP
jgi:hypothetical protein